MSLTVTQMQSEWTELKQFPFWLISKPLWLNEKEFIVIPDKHYSCKADGIYKYNINNNEWIKTLNYKNNLRLSTISPVLDEEKKIIYICTQFYPRAVFKIDLNTKEIKIFSKINKKNSGRSELIFVNNKLHLIGSRHYIVDTETKQIKKMHCFDEFNLASDYFDDILGCSGHSLLYLKSTKSILLFGGAATERIEVYDSIYEFCMETNKWNKWSISMPVALSDFGIVTTKNDEFIIIFGGFASDFVDSIFVYIAKYNEFKKSSIKCPARKCYHAIISNEINDELLTFGFIRKYYQLKQSLPNYLKRIVSNYVCNENIYLLSKGYSTQLGRHWKISVDKIIASIQH